MKLIIAGGRKIKLESPILVGMLNTFGLNPSEVVSGQAEGVDSYGEAWAKANKIHVEPFPPDYITYADRPRYAPIARNKEMAKYADALLLIWNGDSSGSANMKSEMQRLGKPIYEVILKK